MSPLQLFKTQHTGQTQMFWSVFIFLGSYGFRENVDEIAESIYKNRIYSKARNATEFVNFWMIKRRLVTQFELWYELCMWILKRKKTVLNMNPACSVSLGMYEWRRRSFVYYTNTEAHLNSRWFLASASHYMKHMNTNTYRLWESLHENFTISFEKTSIISYCISTHKLHGNPSK